MKRFVAVIIFAFLSILLMIFMFEISDFSHLSSGNASFVLSRNLSDFNIPNIVTSVVTQYRGYDTIGEITILFLAVTGIYMLISAMGLKSTGKLLEPAGNIVKSASIILFPIIMIFGIYIIVNGHLSPGGGFQGGAVIGSGMLLLFLSDRRREISSRASHAVESMAVIIILLIGLIGIYTANIFLVNFMGTGMFSSIISGGIIPIIYSLIGIKVTVEFFHLTEHILRS
ncbi:MAG: MnhB domain-containing protein [candidate division WOR-3 bacterium]|nr:MnhB domain-containing protein [candidate division WOR-3 bacterium]